MQNHNLTVSAELKERLSKIKHVALDMDGTIYLGSTLFPFTKKFLADMSSEGIGYSFLTNNPSKSVADYLKKLEGLGIEADEENMYTTSLAAIDYIKRESEFTAAVGGKYMLVCPAAVGRPQKYDTSEIDRSIDSLSRVADVFVNYGIRAAIEPIRSAETSIVHSIAEANAYIDLLNHPGVQHINGDVYHMLVEESHIGESLLAAGKRLTNLHMADTNRCALGDGSLDIDTIIMALYLLGYNNDDACFVTPEPLGPGGDPYPAQNAKTDPAILDKLVFNSVNYFRAREEEVLAL